MFLRTETGILTDEEKYIKVGELLVYADVVSSSDITEAIQVSRRLNIPIGRVLLTSGCVSEPILHATLELQPLVREGQVPLESAIKALKRVYSTGNTLKHELERLNFKPKYGKGENFLADLLIDSNIVSQEQIDQALKTSFHSGTPLGTTLVLQGALSPSFFPSILDIHNRIHDGEITHSEGINELKSAFHLWIKAEASLREELLRSAEGKSQTSTQDDKAQSKALGKKQGKNNKKAQESGSHDSSERRSGQATEARGDGDGDNQSSRQKDGYPQSEPAAERPERSPRQVEHSGSEPGLRLNPRPGSGRLIDLLQSAGISQNNELEAAFQLMLDDSQRTADFLVASGLIDDNTRRNALRCQSLINRGKLRQDEALAALKEARAGHVRVADILKRDGIVDSGQIDPELKSGIAYGVAGGFIAALISLFVAIFRLIRSR